MALIVGTASVLVAALVYVVWHAIVDTPPVCTSAVYDTDGTATVFDEAGNIVAVGVSHRVVEIMFNR